MSEKEFRRSMAVLPMGTVMLLTSLTARQIRYYDDCGLVVSKRTDSNRRLYSLDNVDRILEVKDYIKEGMNIEQIKRVYEKQKHRRDNKLSNSRKGVSDTRVREYLHDDIMKAGGFNVNNNPQFKQGHL
ncbi:MerR family transcriptional regulator [Fructilactobacillus vespulae]|uniref:MerR family transcriptional regulator n=1 Tax=Fructilactobacillus vespulae TaxID=1249630 RepID=UPI0039B48D5B